MQLFTTTVLLALLPSLIVGDQVPLKDKAAGWFDKAKQYVPSGSNPIDAGAAKVAEAKVQKINQRNWERVLRPKLEGQEEWMVYMTGGNKSCFGRCGNADLAWNESVPMLAALPSSLNLKLGKINCEAEEVLCTGLAVALPAVYHFLLPQQIQGAPQPASPFREIMLNATTVKTSDIVSIPTATKKRYLEYPEYTGAFHPVDGWLAKYQLLIPLGYVLWGFGSTPSWMIMLGISFFSRQYMANRASRRPDITGSGMGARPAAPAGGAAAKKRN